MTFAVTPARDHVCQEKAAMSSRNILCFERYRAKKTEESAQRLDQGAALESPFLRYDHGPRRARDARQLAHRKRMLQHGYRKSKVKSQKSKVKSQK
jgi:hypothetical protein